MIPAVAGAKIVEAGLDHFRGNDEPSVQDTAIEQMNAADALAANAQIEEAKTRRLRTVVGGLTALALTAGGVFGYATYRGFNTVDGIRDDVKNLFHAAAPKPTIDVVSRTAIKDVKVTGDQQLSYGLVESTTKLDTSVKSVGVTWIGTKSHNSTTVLKTVNAMGHPEAFHFDTGHNGTGKKPTEYYPLVTVDVDELYAETADPTEGQLTAAGYSPNTPKVQHEGDTGALISMADGVADMIGLLGADPNMDRATFTEQRATDAALAHCEPVVDTTITAGVAKLSNQAFRNAIALDASIPGGTDKANFLRTVAAQPTHIRFVRYSEQTKPNQPIRETVIDPTSVHLYQGEPITDIHSEIKHAKGALKTEIDLTSDFDKDCQINPDVSAELVNLATDQQQHVVLEGPTGRVDIAELSKEK